MINGRKKPKQAKFLTKENARRRTEVKEQTKKIQIRCYNETTTYPESEREKLIKEFYEGMMYCEGSEAERYANIYVQLKEGYSLISDTY